MAVTKTIKIVELEDDADGGLVITVERQLNGDVHIKSPTLGDADAGVLGINQSAAQHPKILAADVPAWKAGIAAFKASTDAKVAAFETANGPQAAPSNFAGGDSTDLVDDPTKAVGDGQTAAYAEAHSPDGLAVVPGRFIIGSGGADFACVTYDLFGALPDAFTDLGY